MSKIKKVWEENKVLMVLAIILAVCLLIVGIVSITYFYGSSDSVYGNRLDATKNVKISKELENNLKSEARKSEGLTNVETLLKGKIYYIRLEFNDDVTMDSAKLVADTLLPLFSEEVLEVYDLEFTIKNQNYTLMGARNSNGSGNIIWNNYNIKEPSEGE